MISILTSAVGLATSYLDGKAKVKSAEAETRMKLATGEISWEQAAIKSSDGSLKDEAWTAAFILIILGNFIPGCQDFMARGFANLETTPQWVQAGIYASIAASFGFRTLKGFKK